MAIKTRQTTATGVTNKDAPLTNDELDNNFVELQQNKADLSGATFTGDISIDSADASLTLEGTASASIVLQDTGAATSQQVTQLLNNGGDFVIRSLNDTKTGVVATAMTVENLTGNVGIGVDPQSFSKLQVKTDTNKQIAMFSNANGATVGGITDVGGSTTLRLAGSPLVMTGGGGSGATHVTIDSAGDATFSNSIITGNTSARESIEVKSSEWPEVKFTSPTHASGMRLGMTHAAASGYGVAQGDGYIYNANTNSMMLIVPRDGSSLKRQTAVNATPYTIWDSGNDGSNSGLDADTVDGIQASSFIRNDTSNSVTNYANKVTFFSNTNAATTSGSQASLECYSSGAGNDAFMAFHVGGDYATYFGLDGDTNDLFVGGWSKGASRYKIWHAGNDGSSSGLDADTVDGIQGASFLRSDASDTATGLITFDNEIRINNGNGSATHFNYSDGSTNYIRGTLLRVDADVTEFNKDATDVVNFTAASTNSNRGIAFNSRTALSASNAGDWLRLNNNSEFTSGTYSPLNIRTDADLIANTNVIAGATSAPSGAGQVALIGNSTVSTSPYLSFHESGGTRRAYIQYNIGGNYLFVYNEEASDIVLRGNATTAHTYFQNSNGAGGRITATNTTIALQHDNGEAVVDGMEDSWARIFYNGIPRLETTTAGVKILGGAATSGRLEMRTLNDGLLGSVYGTTDGYIGFLDADGSWAYQHDKDTHHKMYINAQERFSLNDSTLTLTTTSDETISLEGSSNPYIRWCEGTTDRAYIQYVSGTNSFRFRNQETGTFDMMSNSASGAINVRYMGTDGDVWGSVYATDAQEIGFLDEGGSWAFKIVNDNRIEFRLQAQEEMRLEADGDLHVEGDVIAFSTTVSDSRLKENIKNIENALDKVDQINGVTFLRKTNGEESAGVIAQEIMEVLPEAVREKALPLQTGSEDDKYYVVEYDAVTGLLVEAIKELKARVEALESK